MDEQVQSESKSKFAIPIAVAALVILAVVSVFAFQSLKGNREISQSTPTPTPTLQSSSPYKDGIYKVVGNYVSPGGPREIDVTLTLKDGVVTDSVFLGKATDPNSKRFQGEFAAGYKEFVIGKNIDEIAITKVSGSSLTPKGFKDALEKIKAEAQV